MVIQTRSLRSSRIVTKIETDRRDDEEVYGDNIWSMTTQEAAPLLA
jgi:hypothetical protein